MNNVIKWHAFYFVSLLLTDLLGTDVGCNDANHWTQAPVCKHEIIPLLHHFKHIFMYEYTNLATASVPFIRNPDNWNSWYIWFWFSGLIRLLSACVRLTPVILILPNMTQKYSKFYLVKDAICGQEALVDIFLPQGVTLDTDDAAGEKSRKHHYHGNMATHS